MDKYILIQEFDSDKRKFAQLVYQSLRASGIDTQIDKGGTSAGTWFMGLRPKAKIYVVNKDKQKALELIQKLSFADISASPDQKRKQNQFSKLMIGILITTLIIILLAIIYS